jgi:hypothetical protein
MQPASRRGDLAGTRQGSPAVSRLSIVIPCLGGAADFDGTLVAVLQHRPADCQLIVVHRQPYDDPYRLGGEVEFHERPQAGSLCDLLNAGIELAEASIVHVLACGLEPVEGWTEPALAHFRDEEVAAVAPALLDASGTKLLAAGVRLSAGGSRCVLRDRRLLLPGSGHLRAAIRGPTLTAGFYRREVLEILGGFDAAATDRLADVALALDLEALELRTQLEPASRIARVIDPLFTAPDNAFARGRAAERLFWQNAGNVGLPLALAAHALTATASTLADLPNPAGLVGRTLALCEVGSVRRREARLAAAADRLAARAEESILPLRRELSAVPSRQTAQKRRAA